MCTNCLGSGYSKGYNDNETHNVKCHVGRCINGWIECGKCYSDTKCEWCYGKGYNN
jgi:hypothetical protein